MLKYIREEIPFESVSEKLDKSLNIDKNIKWEYKDNDGTDEVISISIKIKKNSDVFKKVPLSYEFLDLENLNICND